MSLLSKDVCANGSCILVVNLLTQAWLCCVSLSIVCLSIVHCELQPAAVCATSAASTGVYVWADARGGWVIILESEGEGGLGLLLLPLLSFLQVLCMMLCPSHA